MNDALRLPESVQTMPEALAFWAGQTPDAPALRAIDGRELSFRELQDAVSRVAIRFAALGIGREDRVAIVLAPGFETSIALLGTTAVAVAVPFNPAISAPELSRDLERLGARLLVTGGISEEKSRGVAASLGVGTVGVDELVGDDEIRHPNESPHPNPSPIAMGEGHSAPVLVQEQPVLPSPRSEGRRVGDEGLSPESIAAILHTSGTTGLPKRVLRPHRTFLAGARASRLCSDLSPDDTLLLTVSLHTNMGLSNLCAALFNGGGCVAAPGFDPAAVPRWLDEHRPTWMVATATELNLILDQAAAAGREAVAGPASRLRLVRVGAQPMTPGTVERAEASLRAPLYEGFGMTEATYIAGFGPGRHDRRQGSCGPPLSCEVRVLDELGEDLPAGTAGEIVIRGAALFPGYLDEPEANAAVFLPGGWFRTGDLGYLDEDGYLYLIGRFNELINRGGEKIAPVEVDHALMTHPAVAEVATFAVPDDRLGEDIVAAVVFRPAMTATARELRGWLLRRLTPFKVPRRIWAVERLPRTPTGKVQRGELARRWREERG